MNNNLRAALKWAEAGYRVFPAVSQGERMKAPHINGWKRLATSDKVQIESWWAQFPDAAVGLVCGRKNELTVVDCDNHPEHGSALWAAELAKYFPNWRELPHVRTPSGGVHLFFQFQEGLKNNVRALPKIDLRTEGGYVIAPNSVIETGKYKWVNEPELALELFPIMPASLVEAMSRKGNSKTPAVERNEVSTGNTSYGTEALKREIESLRNAKEGERNHALNRAAFNLGQLTISSDLDESEVKFELECAACEIGLDESEIQATIRSGLAGGKKNPRPERSAERQTLINAATQDSIALAAAMELEGKALYMRDAKIWLHWTGTHWARDHFATAENLVRRLAREGNKGNKAAPASNSFIEGCVRLLEKDKRLMALLSDFDNDPNLLNTLNGLIHLKENRLEPQNPDQRITKITNASRGKQTKSRFATFIDEITGGDNELARFLQTAFGACLGGAIESHWLLFLVGNGRNGKSLLLETIVHALGDYATEAPEGLLLSRSGNQHPTELMTLRGARMVVASEIDEGQVWATARVKKLTGDATITARYMGKDFVSFHRTYKIAIAANARPAFQSIDTAISSRFKIVPFSACFLGKEDPDLPAQLREEKDVILRWLLDGHNMWMKNGQKLPFCQAVEDFTQSYFDDQSTPSNWLDDECSRLDEGVPKKEWMKANLAYAHYRAWAKSQGIIPVQQRQFGEEMRKEGVPKSRARGSNIYGLAINASQGADFDADFLELN